VRDRAVQVRAELARARSTGAYGCAPRELAEADFAYEAAGLDLEVGRSDDAEEHVAASEEALNKAFARCGVAVVEKPKGPADADGDGIPDTGDACPQDAGPKEHAGCPDLDGDGFYGDLDRCPVDAEDKDGFLDDDGCPDWDNDGDRVADALDACPTQPGSIAARGCPASDRDQDGFADADDRCPDDPGIAESPAGPGCPAQKYKLVIKKKDKLEITQKIQFRTGSGVILPESYPILQEVAQVLKDYPDVKLRIEGHTDDVGGDKANLKLSKWRAAEVYLYLIRKTGVARSRLVFEGYGKNKPLGPNTSEAGREANRRVEFVITAQKQ
jgi:outer membrane protein OmpA-like peptidoglycan-associated protein